MTNRRPHSRFATIFTAAALAAAITLASPSLARAQNQPDSKSDDGNISAGFNLGKDANAKDVGLPLYPGAHRHKDTNDDSSALNMGLWGGSSGFKMALMKMESTDSPEKIAAFYRKALARYGKVLTCPADAAAGANSDAKTSPDSQALTCDSDQSDHHEKNEMELKAGTKEKQHIVGIKPEGTVTTFTLIYIETRGLDDKSDKDK
ncbi:MAG TPA: hypothetical protein VGD60_15400 [Candidatus Acidoferrales bacterium]